MIAYRNLFCDIILKFEKTSGLGTLRPLWTSIFSDKIKNTFYEIKIFYGQYFNYTTLEQ